MKYIPAFLSVVLGLVAIHATAAPVATTLGSNLTAYNPSSGANNNAMWNSYMNPRANTTTSGPVADFGNCNSVILRCAQPKCAGGGCSTMEIARPIVSGCVESNSACKQYGDDLIEYISAQLVSDANATATAAATNAQIAAANAAAQQGSQQMAMMQQQMTAMQQQMQQQSADTAAQIQAALAQQQQATADAIAAAAQQNVQTVTTTTPVQSATTGATTGTTGALTAAQQSAAAAGVSADVLAREQIAGQILSKIEGAETALRSVQAAMTTAFDYAGCDSNGGNCSGPKRVSAFKEKAMQFFDPYDDVLDELYDALILAQSVGVDITDIYMMLNGSCNAWGQYLCAEGQVMHYNSINCPNGMSDGTVFTNGGRVYGNAACKPGQVVPMSDGGCQLIRVLADEEEVQRNWLYPEEGEDGFQVRVGCASEVLDNSPLFRGRSDAADIDIETLKRIIDQDAPSSFGSGLFGGTMTPQSDGIVYCAVNEQTYRDLQSAANLKKLPQQVCVTDREMRNTAGVANQTVLQTSGESDQRIRQLCKNDARENGEMRCLCENARDQITRWENNKCVCEILGYEYNYDTLMCEIPAVRDAMNASDAELQKSIAADTQSLLGQLLK